MAGERDRVRLALALSAGQMAIWELDIASGDLSRSAELNRVLGYPPDHHPSADEIRAGNYPGEADRMRELWQESVARGERHFEIEYRRLWPDGSIRWLWLRVETLLDDAGAPVRLIGVVMDITARKEAEDRASLLAREVDHRANNLLAVVQGIVGLSRASDVEGLRQTITGRIQALARVNRRSAQSGWTGESLERLVSEELEPYVTGDPRRSKLDGLDVHLAPDEAQAVALAIHELATNSAKYGALSAADGSVSVARRGRAGRLAITWTEKGGPSAREPLRLGFGMTLLKSSLTALPDGEVRLDWREAGLRCTMSFVPRRSQPAE